MLSVLRQPIALHCCRCTASRVAVVRSSQPSQPTATSVVAAQRCLSSSSIARKLKRSSELAKFRFESPETTPGHVPKTRSARTVKVIDVRNNDAVSGDRKTRVRLFRLPRTVLEPFFYLETPKLYFTHGMFNLTFRPLRADLVNSINLGPNYLRGDYPAGLLHKRHEERRPINDEQSVEAQAAEAWRDVSEYPVKDETLIKEHVTRTEPTSAKRPLLVHGKDLTETTAAGDLPEFDSVPFLVITSKKRVDKKAAYRNKTKTRLIEAIQEVIMKHVETLPRMDEKGNPLAMVWQLKENAKDYTRLELIEKVDYALDVVSKKHEAESYRFSVQEPAFYDKTPPAKSTRRGSTNRW